MTYREFIDSREAFDEYTPTPEDIEEYNDYLDSLELGNYDDEEFFPEYPEDSYTEFDY